VETIDATLLKNRVCEIIKTGADRASIMGALKAEFPGLEVPAQVFKKVKRTSDMDAEERVAFHAMGMLLPQMADLRPWGRLAKSDPDLCRDSLENLVAAVRRVINSYCGFEAHRPKEDQQERDELIAEMRSKGWSFGQISQNYQLKTGTPISPGNAQLIFARYAARQTEDLIRLLRPELYVEPLLEAIGRSVFERRFCAKDRRRANRKH